MTPRNALLPVLMTLAMTSAAYAEIGGVGSPVKISNPPRAERADAAPVAPARTQPTVVEGAKPLLVIRFNQRHVYFDRALQQAVQATERSRPGSMYDVIAYVPSAAGSRNDRGAADNALGAVLQQMQNLGVPSARITSSTQNSSDVTAPEIDIYVK